MNINFKALNRLAIEISVKYIIINKQCHVHGTFHFFREESPFPAHHGHAVGKVGVVPHGPAATSETIAKEIHQRMSGRQEQQIREELFGENRENASGKM